VDDPLIGCADGGQDAAELGARGVTVAHYEVIRAEADAAFHGVRVAGLEIEPLGVGQGWLTVAL